MEEIRHVKSIDISPRIVIRNVTRNVTLYISCNANTNHTDITCDHRPLNIELQ